MSLPQLALFLVLAAFVGWTLGRVFPDAPLGTDPEFWRVSYRRWRRKRRAR